MRDISKFLELFQPLDFCFEMSNESRYVAKM